MTYKKAKRPRKRIRLGLSWLQRLIRRALLYGGAALIVIGGFWLRDRLQLEHEMMSSATARTVLEFEGELKGNSLRDGLLGSGSSKEEAQAVIKAVRRYQGVGRLYIGDHYRIVRSTDGALRHLTLTRGLAQTIVTREDDGGYHVARSKVPLRLVRRAVRGTIKDSLWMSMHEQGVSDEVIQEFAEIFQWTIDFLTEPRDGDRYSAVWHERVTPDGRSWGREIEAAYYDGKHARRHVAVRYEDRYYDEKGHSLRRVFLRAPLNYRRISSYFSRHRMHPILRYVRPHLGIDYAAPRGTPVVSVGDGRVTFQGWNGGFGKMIKVQHNSVYSTWYGHLSRYGKGIRKGVRVKQGQVIGRVGATGLATGPHLDFRVQKNGRMVNFLKLKLPRVAPLSKAKMPAFSKLRDEQTEQLGVEEEEWPADEQVREL